MKKDFQFTLPYKRIFKKTSPYIEKNSILSLQEGDPVLVGVSGGPDSLALLHFLSGHSLHLQIFPCMVDYGFQEEKRILSSLCSNLELELLVVPGRRPENCYRCSRERKKILFEIASEQGARVIFLGHHGDDLLESFFISLLYGGEIHTFHPVEIFHQIFILARPFSGLFKRELAAYSNAFKLPSLKSPSCPMAAGGKREEVRKLLHAFSEDQKRRLLTTLLNTF